MGSSSSNPTALTIVALDEAVHDRAAFSCGVEQIDTFLRTVAAQAARYYRSRTFVLVAREEPSTIYGFYTIAIHEYRDYEMDPATARSLKVKNLGRIPMLLLAQLGVDIRFKGKGLGGVLLRDAFMRGLSIAGEVGGVAFITDPVNDEAASWYRRHDFVPLVEGQSRLMLPMKTIARAMAQTKTKASS